MYQIITNGIKVIARPFFLPQQSDEENNRYVWGYEITVENESDLTVQLKRRYWQIIDANGKEQVVDGEGVVGEQPILEPRHSFSYQSGCPLTTPSGIMKGYYTFLTLEGETLKINIPAFSLDSPFVKKSLN